MLVCLVQSSIASKHAYVYEKSPSNCRHYFDRIKKVRNYLSLANHAYDYLRIDPIYEPEGKGCYEW